MKHSTKVTIRTTIQTAAGFAVLAPTLVDQLGVDKTIPWVAGGLAAAAILARLMATPIFQGLLGKLNTSIENDDKKQLNK